MLRRFFLFFSCLWVLCFKVIGRPVDFDELEAQVEISHSELSSHLVRKNTQRISKHMVQ